MGKTNRFVDKYHTSPKHYKTLVENDEKKIEKMFRKERIANVKKGK